MPISYTQVSEKHNFTRRCVTIVSHRVHTLWQKDECFQRMFATLTNTRMCASCVGIIERGRIHWPKAAQHTKTHIISPSYNRDSKRVIRDAGFMATNNENKKLKSTSSLEFNLRNRGLAMANTLACLKRHQ